MRKARRKRNLRGSMPIENLEPSTGHSRLRLDEAGLQELIASIEAHGILQPIVVTPIEGKPGRYEIVDGERRWRAAKKIGVRSVPAVVAALRGPTRKT